MSFYQYTSTAPRSYISDFEAAASICLYYPTGAQRWVGRRRERETSCRHHFYSHLSPNYLIKQGQVQYLYNQLVQNTPGKAKLYYLKAQLNLLRTLTIFSLTINTGLERPISAFHTKQIPNHYKLLRNMHAKEGNRWPSFKWHGWSLVPGCYTMTLALYTQAHWMHPNCWSPNLHGVTRSSSAVKTVPCPEDELRLSYLAKSKLQA